MSETAGDELAVFLFTKIRTRGGEMEKKQIEQLSNNVKKLSNEVGDIPENFLERDDILDKVKALVVLPDGIHVTLQQAAEYYEVDSEVIKNHIKRHRSKFLEDGMQIVRGEELKVLKNMSPNLIDKRTPVLTILPRRSVLRLGFLIEISQVAEQVREYALHLDHYFSPYRKILEPPIEFKGKRILLSDQVNKLLGTSPSGAKLAKRRHARLLKEGIHYFDIQGEDLKELKNKYPERIDKRTPKLTGFTLEGFIILMEQSRDGDRDAIPDVARYFGADPDQFNVIKPISKEGNFRKQLEGAFDGVYEIQRQVVVDDYRLDFYFPEFKLVVEFDEDYHKMSTQQIKDKNREKNLMRKHGFTFIRVSEHEDFYVAVNRILLAINELESMYYKYIV